jgi:hypothetical protein
MKRLRKESDSLKAAVEVTIFELDLTESSKAHQILAKRYAKVLDEHEDDPFVLGNLGPKLLTVLTALGAARVAPNSSTGQVLDGPGRHLEAVRDGTWVQDTAYLDAVVAEVDAAD